MASKALSSFTSLSPKALLPHGVSSSSSASQAVFSLGFSRHTGGRAVVVASSSTVDTNNMPMTGVVFQPFEEVKKADLAIPITSHASLARQRFADASEAVDEGENEAWSLSGITAKQTRTDLYFQNTMLDPELVSDALVLRFYTEH